MTRNPELRVRPRFGLTPGPSTSPRPISPRLRAHPNEHLPSGRRAPGRASPGTCTPRRSALASPRRRAHGVDDRPLLTAHQDTKTPGRPHRSGSSIYRSTASSRCFRVFLGVFFIAHSPRRTHSGVGFLILGPAPLGGLLSPRLPSASSRLRYSQWAISSRSVSSQCWYR